MKKLQKKLIKNTALISELMAELENINTSPYYQIFSNQLEMKCDLEDNLKARKQALNKRFTILENIQLEATKLKQSASTQMRELNLKIA